MWGDQPPPLNCRVSGCVFPAAFFPWAKDMTGHASRLLVAVLVALSVSHAVAWDVARTPPMGWNSWDYWHCAVNATILMDSAKAFVNYGLAKVGCVSPPSFGSE